MFTRRQCLAVLPFALKAAAVKAANAAPLPGAQLYSVRGILKRDPDGVLKAIAGIGYKEVEGYHRLDTIALAPRIKETGLAVRSCQTETPLITADWENYPEFKQVPLKAAIEGLSGAGIEFFKMGYIAPGARGDGDDFYRRTADRMNAAAELCRRSGLKFIWQNHAFEFAGRPGLRPIDIFRDRLDPKLVRMEIDPFWAGLAGQDPIRLLKEWKGSVSFLRLDDKAEKAKAVPVQFEETIGPGAYAEPGAGVLDLPAIIKAARSAGVQYYLAGIDEAGGDPIESLRRSFAYFRNLQVI
jgi:sugar phosphate isomerase/epimerase